MKITADFYTPDEAAYAAGAVKNNFPEIKDVSISGRPSDFIRNERNSFISGYIFQNNTAYGLGGGNPIYAVGRDYSANRSDNEKRGTYTASVICTKDKARDVAGILINRGGHNITEE